MRNFSGYDFRQEHFHAFYFRRLILSNLWGQKCSKDEQVWEILQFSYPIIPEVKISFEVWVHHGTSVL
jgi:hypothetical protein